ncbi:MAG: signal transduction histidine kinase [Rhodoferax sp.]
MPAGGRGVCFLVLQPVDSMTKSLIQTRMLLTALLPVTLLALLLAGVFLFVQSTDLEEAHNQRASSLARQLATASEYGLSSGNLRHLQTIADRALLEPDVLAVAMLDVKGRYLARAGLSVYTDRSAPLPLASALLPTAVSTDLLSQPITDSSLRRDDLFEVMTLALTSSQVMGHVLISFSRAALLQRVRNMWLLGLAITLGALLLGGLLAVRLGQRVMHPILRMSEMIERIGQGELATRNLVLPDDPLQNLQRGLNQMAERLELGRDELEQRVTLATLALREKKEEAETATQAKSYFLAAASHDLRQPTHALGMFVARLAQLPHDSQTRHLIGNLEASVQAMQDLLDGLLDISRLDAQSVQVQLRPFPLADIFDSLEAGLGVTALEKGLRLRIRPTPVWLLSDPALLQRLLLNLVVNAVRYTATGSVLVVCRVEADGLHARIEVWDSGIGIAPVHQQAIFKEFYQVGNKERDRSKGQGLGLNIVERTAHLLGHRLQMRSSLGRGTRFSVQVPLLPKGTPLPQALPGMTSLGDDLAGLVVLVVEDDALAREGLVSLLASWGSVVGVAEDLTSALWQLTHGLMPDVIVSDYLLRAGEVGIEVIRQVRLAACRPIPACLMSGDTDPKLMQAAKRAGLTLLHKPVRPAKLRSLIRRLAADAQVDRFDLR